MPLFHHLSFEAGWNGRQHLGQVVWAVRAAQQRSTDLAEIHLEQYYELVCYLFELECFVKGLLLKIRLM
jgi:hypothetical protein